MGAAPGQVVVTDSTSVNLFKAFVAAARMRPGRTVVLTDQDSFPTDLYVLDGAARLAGLTVERVPPHQAVARLREIGDDVALAAYSSVDYRTGVVGPALDHPSGARRRCLASWDLCPRPASSTSAWTTMAPTWPWAAGTSTSTAGRARRPSCTCGASTRRRSTGPITGWHGHARPFAMEGAFDPVGGITRARVGTGPMLSILALEAALSVRRSPRGRPPRAVAVAHPVLRRVPGRPRARVGRGDPREDERRGSQVAVRHPEAYAVVQALMARGIVGDFREPDLVRLELRAALRVPRGRRAGRRGLRRGGRRRGVRARRVPRPGDGHMSRELHPEAVRRLRLTNQRLVGSTLTDPAAVVSSLVAMQAQEYAMAKWAIGLRLADGGSDDAVEAACDDGRILRLHLLRPTWHFVAAEDLRLVLQVTAEAVHQANAFMYRSLGLDAVRLDRFTDFVRVAGRPEPPHAQRDSRRSSVGLGRGKGFQMAYLMMYAGSSRVSSSAATS